MKLTTRIQYILPQHALSRLFGKLLQSQHKSVKNTLIKMFIAYFNVNMDEVADPHLDDYACFNDFFTRTLKKDARPIANNPNAIASPVDGTIAQMGIAQQERLIQAKNHHFSLTDLLGGDKVMAEDFLNGPYTTIYLGPRDYHRVHMPVNGTLKKMIFVPGKLFSVNRSTVDDVSNLFARNERVICLFETDAGPMALIMVGAIFVGSMAVAWQGVITPERYNEQTVWTYEDRAITLKRGDELGYFVTGSTVICLFAQNALAWEDTLQQHTLVKMGQEIGQRKH